MAEVHVTVLDLNDNAPEFVGDPYEVTLPSLAASGSEVMAVVAVDLDLGMNGTVVYGIVPVQGEALPFYIQTRGE